ncbi:hypothetical protein [Amycolatopsis sp. DSM 110486]|uniref:hypothetical protein n=1 Tax=Amycolatopsis sp. DSM 110486 TaxID=2865832 RepID=UPI001C696393|nr:hypothetical protein [Amycolatopsis sp. DSM 110486]QYN17468.1 hypothetical protein K1T34_32290 [Amycolatopsis sp. DSM 110486]
MTKEETAALLAIVTSFDHRNAGESDIWAWTKAAEVAGWSFEEAAAVVVEHLSVGTPGKFLEPRYVTQLIRERRTKRLLPGWCGECGSEFPDERAKKNPRFRYHTNPKTEERVMCACHPNHPQQKRLP